MHPIERLRLVAGSRWVGPSELGTEAAFALADLCEYDATALLPACRRLLEHNPSVGTLWWLAARVLSAADPATEARACGNELIDDPTPDLTDTQLAVGGSRVVRRGAPEELASADVVLVEALAVGADATPAADAVRGSSELAAGTVAAGVRGAWPLSMVVERKDEATIRAAGELDLPIWVEAGVGRVLPARLWCALCSSLGEQVPSPSCERVQIVAVSDVEKVFVPIGAVAPSEALLQARSCPEPADLLTGRPSSR